MSTEPKFTPGPWKCDKRPAFGSWFVRQDPHDWNGMGYQLICDVPADKKGTHYGDMFAANAHLIAAAPDMFAALVSAEIAAMELCIGQDPANQCWVVLAEIRAALSKATGAA